MSIGILEIFSTTSSLEQHMTCRPHFRRFAIPGLAAASSILLAGCAITPEPLQRDDLRQIVRDDQRAAGQNVAPVSGPITLPEAVARALKYNLEHRTRLWEEALAVGQLDVSRFDMLPKMLADLGYNSRDQDSATWSPDAQGRPSTNRAPVSADRTHKTTDFGLSWSVLDFGLSYYGAHQNADRVLIATERRRKALHTIIQNVRTAFWRAASAEKLAGEVRQTIDLAEKALADSRKLAASLGKAPADALRYQRTLLENLRTLETVDRELAAARIELANLLNLPVGMNFKLAEPVGTLAQPGPLGLPIERMEEMALEHNADLRENVYNARIAATETRKALLKLFPNLSFNVTSKHDSNSFLVNQGWNEAALRMSWNVFNLLSGPSQMDVAETAVKVAESRRVTMQMAVLTQVHLATRQYDTAVRLYERSDAIWRVDDGLLEFARQGVAAETQSQQMMVASRSAAILSLVRRYQALAGVHEAASKLEATLGLDPRISSLDDISLPDLTRLIEKSLSQWPGKAAEANSATEHKVAANVPSPAAAAASPVAVSPAPTFAAAPHAAAATQVPPIEVKRSVTENKTAGNWVVQLGAHRNPASAREIARLARTSNLPVFIEEGTTGHVPRTKVRAGPFLTNKDAEAALEKLASIGLEGHVKPR
jgi:outer membrane protein TolC/cell division septation protein DedD